MRGRLSLLAGCLQTPCLRLERPLHSRPPSPAASDEFEERAKQIDHEETQRLESAAPAETPAGLLESAGCEHLSEQAFGGLVAQPVALPACLSGCVAELWPGPPLPAQPTPPAAAAACAGAGEAHFAHAMCKACYLEFMQVGRWGAWGVRSSGGVMSRGSDSGRRVPAGQISSASCRPACPTPSHCLPALQSSGGVYNGANPPAYDRARRKEEQELLALPEPGALAGCRGGVWGVVGQCSQCALQRCSATATGEWPACRSPPTGSSES